MFKSVFLNVKTLIKSYFLVLYSCLNNVDKKFIKKTIVDKIKRYINKKTDLYLFNKYIIYKY